MDEPDTLASRFARVKPLTDEERSEQMAEAVWHDINSTWGRPALLRGHHANINDHKAYRFPFEDRAYLLHRDLDGKTWAITLYAAPSAEDPDFSIKKEGILVSGQPTQRAAVMQLVRNLFGTVDDHGYIRCQDSCPGCDYFQDAIYPNLP